jgi:diaminopimelate epimerase
MRFSKWQALGNSYLVLETPRLVAGQARWLCDPVLGIGADGVAQVVAREGARAEVVIWNPDGSAAEMSGNGTRIAAAWLAAEVDADEVTIVAAGRKVRARILPDGLETDIGAVQVGSLEVIDVDGEPVEMTPASVGNPHAVIEAVDLSRDALLRLGPAVERHARFPERTNVQLARPLGRHDVDALVWERGAGETTASGSSAVAVAAVAVARGWCDSPVAVHMPGGELCVELDDRGHAILRGPAQLVCVGEVEIARTG